MKPALLIAFALLLSLPMAGRTAVAASAGTDDARVAALLDALGDAMNGPGGGHLSHGPVRVRSAGGELSFEIDDLRFAGADGTLAELGTITGTTQRTGDIERGEMTIRDNRIRSSGGADGNVTTSMAGNWIGFEYDLKHDVLTQLDAELTGVSIAADEDPGILAIGSLTLESGATATDGDMWQNTARLRIRDMSIDPGDGAAPARVAAVRLDARAARLDYPLLLALGGDGDADDAGDLLAALLLGNLVGDLDVSVGIDGITGETENGEFRLGRLDLATRLEGLDRSSATIEVGMEFDGVEAAGANGNAPLADAGAVAAAVERLPIQALGPAVADLLLIGANRMDPALAGRLLAELQAAGSAIALRDARVSTPDGDASLAGRLTADGASPFGASGRFELSVEGLEEHARRQRGAAKRGDAATARRLAWAPALLQLGDVLPDTAPHDFLIEVARTGAITINGRNALPLLPLLLGMAN